MMKQKIVIMTTLLLSPLSVMASPDLDGIWSSAFGDITLVTQGNIVQGSYGKGRKIHAQLDPKTGILRGYWLSPSSSNPCKTLKYGSKNWGQLEWTFSDAKPPTFQGHWNYCDQALTLKWKGSLKKANPKQPPLEKKPAKKISPQERARRQLMNDKSALAIAKAAIVQLNACYQEAEMDKDIAALCASVYNARLDNLDVHLTLKLPPKITHNTWNKTIKQQTLADNQSQLQQLELGLSCLDKGADAQTLSQCIANKGNFTPTEKPKKNQNAKKPSASINDLANPLLQGYQKGLKVALPKYQQAMLCYQSANDLHIAKLCQQMYVEAKTAEDNALNQALGLPKEDKTFAPHRQWNNTIKKDKQKQAEQEMQRAQWGIVCIDKGATLFSIDACIQNQGKLSGGRK